LLVGEAFDLWESQNLGCKERFEGSIRYPVEDVNDSITLVVQKSEVSDHKEMQDELMDSNHLSIGEIIRTMCEFTDRIM